MPNITLSIDERLLKAGRQYAKEHDTSLNALVRQLLEQRVVTPPSDWLTECFELMDRAGANSGGTRWTRDELYDV